MSKDRSVLVGISLDEALVLFEWLSEMSDRGKLEDLIGDTPVWLALSSVLGSLESTLVEPFDSDYKKLLEAARARLGQRAPS